MPHIHEKIDFTVTAYIVYKNKVLLRKHDKYGIWMGVGGHIDLDEEPNKAVIREVKEEVGLDISIISSRENQGKLSITRNDFGDTNFKELIPPEYLNIHNITPAHRHIDMLYFATSDTDKITPENQTDQWKWLTKEEIENMKNEIPESAYKYALKALEVVSKN